MEDWDKIKKQIVEQPNLEYNGNFPWYLMIEIRRQIGGDKNTIMFYYRVYKFDCGNLRRHNK